MQEDIILCSCWQHAQQNQQIRDQDTFKMVKRRNRMKCSESRNFNSVGRTCVLVYVFTPRLTQVCSLTPKIWLPQNDTSLLTFGCLCHVIWAFGSISEVELYAIVDVYVAFTFPEKRTRISRMEHANSQEDHGWLTENSKPLKTMHIIVCNWWQDVLRTGKCSNDIGSSFFWTSLCCSDQRRTPHPVHPSKSRVFMQRIIRSPKQDDGKWIFGWLSQDAPWNRILKLRLRSRRLNDPVYWFVNSAVSSNEISSREARDAGAFTGATQRFLWQSQGESISIKPLHRD